MLPLVSIITPSYNQGIFIESTILSVLNQDYPNVEYIIIDGGSTDITQAIVEKYNDKLVFISEQDEGQSDAINKGFKLAKGDIVAWLNSDDTYEPGAIKTAVNYFMEHKNIGLVYGEGDIIDRDGNKIKRFFATQQFDLWVLIHLYDYIMQPTTFFRREALESVGYLDKGLHWCMDWDLWIKLANKYDIGYINQVMANSREYADTKTSTGGWKRLQELIKLMRKYGELRYSPGYYFYGMSTIVSCANRIPLISHCVNKISGVVYSKIYSNLPIRYSDGWIGRKVCLSVPCFKNKLVITGDALFKYMLPIKLRIYVGKLLIGSYEIDTIGKFEFNVNLNFPVGDDKIKHITIITDIKSGIKKRDNGKNDKRDLRLLITSIDLR